MCLSAYTSTLIVFGSSHSLIQFYHVILFQSLSFSLVYLHAFSLFRYVYFFSHSFSFVALLPFLLRLTCCVLLNMSYARVRCVHSIVFRCLCQLLPIIVSLFRNLLRFLSIFIQSSHTQRQTHILCKNTCLYNVYTHFVLFVSIQTVPLRKN